MDATILTDWDHKGGERVTTDDTAVIHDVLRCYLTVKWMKEVRLRLLLKLCSTVFLTILLFILVTYTYSR